MLAKAALAVICCTLTVGASGETTAAWSSSSHLLPIAPASSANSYRVGMVDGALYAGVVAYRTLDYLSTEPCVHSLYCEEKELPHFVVDTKPGFIVFESSATAIEIASSYLLHRRGHGKMARALDLISISSGAWAVQHNYGLRSRQ
jgi:hypothetical protein